ncbi:MAG: hypothetical protein V3T14_14255, partial [Myxococcota bacterium]
VLTNRLVVGGHRRIEVAHGVPAGTTNLVAKLEAIDFADVPYPLAVLLGATRLGLARGDDPLGIVVPRSLFVCVANDVSEVALRLLLSGS